MLFEPIAVFAIIGIVLLIVDSVKKRSYHILGIVVLVIISIGWRYFLPVLSKRYFATLIFPGMFFAAYTCKRIPEFFAKYSKTRNIISGLLIAILLVVCFFKMIRPDRHAEALNDVASLLKEQASKNDVVFSYPDDSQRLKFLTTYDIFGSPVLDKKHDKELSEAALFDVIQTYLHVSKNVYVVTKGVCITRKETNPEIANCEQIAEFFSGRKSNLNVYKISAKRDLVSCNVSAFNPDVEKNIKFLGFESVLSANSKEYKGIKSQLKQLNVSAVVPDGKALPAGWSILNTGVIFPENSFFMSERNSIRGKYSLYVCGRPRLNFWCLQAFKVSDVFISFVIKGKPGTKIALGAHLYDENNSYKRIRFFLKKELSDGKLHKITYSISKDIFREAALFRPLITVEDGFVFLDNFYIKCN